MIKATIIADSVSAHTEQRITTFELEYPRFILAELNTHRAFSRNSASSRAIPIDKMIEQVQNNPAFPIHWGLNQSGMQAKDEQAEVAYCLNAWIEAKNRAVESARELQGLGLHKQIVNRVLEPFQTIKTLVTATSFDNFFNLRCDKDAQPEIKELADKMYQAMQESTPEVLYAGEWHTPYVHHLRHGIDDVLEYYIWDNDENVKYLTKEEAIIISCSCAAQVSYRKNDTSIEKATSLFSKLINSEPAHSSAFEHCATPIDVDKECYYGLSDYDKVSAGITAIALANENQEDAMCSGNFSNWIQYRQLIKNNTCHKYIPNKKGNLDEQG